MLQPKDHLPQDYKVHLSRILQNLEVCRKITGENIKDAQDKYKYQYDKRSKVPDYSPAQRVWLYCTKVPPGKAPKLHRKWVGPYYITMVDPNHTFRLQNVKTNAEIRSLVNAMRLKPYFDSEDRPTNPPEQLVDNEDELDPEELDTVQRILVPDDAETGDNGKKQAEVRQKNQVEIRKDSTIRNGEDMESAPKGQNKTENTSKGPQSQGKNKFESRSKGPRSQVKTRDTKVNKGSKKSINSDTQKRNGRNVVENDDWQGKAKQTVRVESDSNQLGRNLVENGKRLDRAKQTDRVDLKQSGETMRYQTADRVKSQTNWPSNQNNRIETKDKNAVKSSSIKGNIANSRTEKDKQTQTSMYHHYFSNFGKPLVPNDLCKDSATRHPRVWRRRFFKVFTIYGHGSHLGL